MSTFSKVSARLTVSILSLFIASNVLGWLALAACELRGSNETPTKTDNGLETTMAYSSQK